MIRRIYSSLFFVLISLTVIAEEIELNANHPQNYVVIKGDTLWDIAGKFLKYPWHWPEIWQANPQIENPHLIYPGDRLWLADCDGRSCIKLARGIRSGKISPKVREIELDEAIATIPLSAISPFLSQPRVVGEEVLGAAPYIVAGSEERLISAAGDNVYVRGIDATINNGKHYNIFRKGIRYQDPETGEILGFEAIYLADALLRKTGDPATVELRTTNREVMIGDRLLEADDTKLDLNFIPRQPTHKIDGHILSVFDGVSQVGQYQIVVLNRGERDNLESGHVVFIHQVGDTIKDIVLSGVADEGYFSSNKNSKESNIITTLPDEYAGIAMVFKTYKKVSYAIIMKATRVIHVGDKISGIK